MLLSEVFERMSSDCSLLVEDLNAIIHANITETKASRKSLEPITRLRKDMTEVVEVENTDENVQFVKDKLSDIFGG